MYNEGDKSENNLFQLLELCALNSGCVIQAADLQIDWLKTAVMTSTVKISGGHGRTSSPFFLHRAITQTCTAFAREMRPRRAECVKIA